MSENKGLVRCVLGFLLAILVVVGGIFGLDVKVEVEDTTDVTAPPAVEDVVPNQDETPQPETQDSPAESTPTEDVQPSVDESEQGEVTPPADDTQTDVTEGEV